MCMAGMTEGPKIIGQNIINYNKLLVSNLYFWGKALGAHPPSPPVPPVLMDIRENAKVNKQKLYMHIWPLSFHNPLCITCVRHTWFANNSCSPSKNNFQGQSLRHVSLKIKKSECPTWRARVTQTRASIASIHLCSFVRSFVRPAPNINFNTYLLT